jgi:hypothetical protein
MKPAVANCDFHGTKMTVTELIQLYITGPPSCSGKQKYDQAINLLSQGNCKVQLHVTITVEVCNRMNIHGTPHLQDLQFDGVRSPASATTHGHYTLTLIAVQG